MYCCKTSCCRSIQTKTTKPQNTIDRLPFLFKQAWTGYKNPLLAKKTLICQWKFQIMIQTSWFPKCSFLKNHNPGRKSGFFIWEKSESKNLDTKLFWWLCINDWPRKCLIMYISKVFLIKKWIWQKSDSCIWDFKDTHKIDCDDIILVDFIYTF